MKILAIGAHPDDIELGAGGTLLKHASKGDEIGLIDLTQGEMGTRGTVEIRKKEAEEAASMLNAKFRYNLKFPDGQIINSFQNQIPVIEVIRYFKPDMVIAPAPIDRHPDHSKACNLVKEAFFLSGLQKIQTQFNGDVQQAFRPKRIIHYIQFVHLQPDFLIDISQFYEAKMQLLTAFGSQLYNTESKEPATLVASKAFYDNITNRAAYFGQYCGVNYAEGFISDTWIGLKSLNGLADL